jgi:hypothetical protein
MKRCPTCQRTYPDDAPDYCPNDGMRLVKEEAAEYDSEKTVMSSGLRVPEPVLPEPPPPKAPPPEPPPFTPPPSTPQPQQSYAPGEPPGNQPPPQWQPPAGQPAPQSPAAQATPQSWSPPQPPYTQPLGTPYQSPSAYAPIGGRSRALAIAALVTGACAVTIMSLLVFRGDRDVVYTSMLVLAIFGIGLGVAALLLSLQKPARFGGIPLAIVGLATGTAALVYYFTL